MSLTKGSGPFGERPAGTFNVDPARPEHVLYIENCPRRVRVVLAGETVADSTDVRLLHPPGRTPTYLFPSDGVRTDLFEPAARRRRDPGMGPATYWDVRVGERCAAEGAYSWEQPPDSARAITGLVAFDWDSMDGVFEEDEEVFVHPRDPYTRIDVLRTSRRVRVRLRDARVADSGRPRMLIESGLPVRWYLPRDDVRTDLLEPSYTTTRCPYKGIAGGRRCPAVRTPRPVPGGARPRRRFGNGQGCSGAGVLPPRPTWRDSERGARTAPNRNVRGRARGSPSCGGQPSLPSVSSWRPPW